MAVASAHAQVSGVDLLRTNPTAGRYNLPARQSDEVTQPGAAVDLPDMQIRDDEPFAMEADEVGYDQANGIVVARGNVEVVQGANILNASQITYFQRRNLVQASGEVSVLQPSGDVYFADYVELKDDMKQGVIRNFRARLADNSLFAANEARKVNPNVTDLKDAVYTPCNVCEDMEPFWQIKARDVQIDQGDETIRYANAHMEIYGVPMMYTPVLSHPTPDAEAKSGFLTPSYSRNSNLGTILQVPYYWRIAPDKDVLLTPWYSTDTGPLLQGDYRQLRDHGNYQLRFSGTFPEELDSAGNEIGGNEFRGHVYADGIEELSTYSRVGFNIQRASDDTYLRRYGFGDQRALFSRVYAEAAKDRNYATVEGLAIQGLRVTDDADTTPLVLPTFEGYYETDPYDYGLTLHAFGNAQSLRRDEGVDQHRLSMTTGATLPVVTEGGHVFKTTASVRQDFYQTDNILINGGAQEFSGSNARTIPQAALEWRYPLIRSFGSDALTIEPIALAVAQPSGNNPQEISNEDNTLIELTDTNLFSLNRMPGLDTVDSGSRFAYGFRSQYLFAQGTSVDTLLGQNYNVDDDTPFPNSTAPGENVSDLIGRVALNYNPITLGYRFALDRKSFDSNRTEFTVGYSEPWFNIDAVYRSLDNNRYLRDSEEGIVNASMPIPGLDEWSVYGGMRRDLALDQMVATNAGLVYQNECFNLYLQSLRTFTRDRDIEPSTQFTLRVGFKNLGEFGDN
ncbi:MAG: hypothetical protein DI582_04215 [Azospirillum brasilense]|nr:MAG: hypothetical protein DI582_04215 [Azospirillum brasilense]